jgi:general secretion pathway protein D
LSLLALSLGCASSTETRTDLELDVPRVTGGILLEETPDEWAEKLSKLNEERERGAPPGEPPSRESAEDSPGTPAAPAAGPGAAQWPSGSRRLIDLPRLSATELEELLGAVALRLEAEAGYAAAPPESGRSVPALPEGARAERLLERRSTDGTHFLRLGYWRYRTHKPQFGVYGALLKDGELGPNLDVDGVEAAIESSITSFEELRGESVPAADLESRIIQLSYIDVPGAMSGLKGLGVTTVAAAELVPRDIVFDMLPVVVELPAPKVEDTGLVGGGAQTQQGQFGSTVVPSLASSLSSQVVASPTQQVLVLFHPGHPEQFSRVQALLDDVLDRPARQIFVEGMVLEIDELGLQELGFDWEFRKGKWDLMLGTLAPGLSPPADTVDILGAKAADLPTDWIVRIQALIAQGKAEVLSRPSVLTLNDRQATIRIGQDVPIATSQEGISADSNKIAFDFKYIPLGIMLNIRPRVGRNAREVSLMVDTVISSRIPEADLQIVDEDGMVVASAPTVQSRRVQTYARIQNNSPFIIGGLVNRNSTRITEKVPILGDIPLLGRLFRSVRHDNRKQEVIIVLTPYVLPERLHLGRALPPADQVDDDGNQLFRDTYVVRQRDIADVSFLYRNQRFITYRRLAQEGIRENFRLAEREPFLSFAGDRVPGEAVLVDRILFRAAQRLGLGEKIQLDRVFLVTGRQGAGYEVAFLERMLADEEVAEDYESFFTRFPGKAVAISFYDPLETTSGESLASDPIPRLSVVDCADRKEWSRLLWDLNQPEAEGSRNRRTILLHRHEDLERLKLAFMVKYILEINGGRVEASLLNFIPGRIFEVPDIEAEQTHWLDASVASTFFHAEHFFTAAVRRIEEKLLDLDRELRRPELRHLLEGLELPPLDEK